MTFNELLDHLIEISELPKTTVAETLNISPSALSKFISGNRVPPQYLVLDFIKDAARLFAENLYKNETYPELYNIFEFLYEFNSAEELEAFLREALMYYYKRSDDSPALCNRDQKNTVVVGKDNIMNYMCIHFSEWLTETEDLNKIVVYSTVWMHIVLDPERASRIILNRPSDQTVTMNHVVHIDNLKNHDSLIYFAREVEEYWDTFNLNFWTCENPPPESFLFVPGHSLLLFDFLRYHEPTLLLITDKDYIDRIGPHLMRYFETPMMHNKKDYVKLLEEGGEPLRQIFDDDDCFVFLFFPISLLLTEDLLAKAIDHKEAAEFYSYIYDKIARNPQNIIISLDSIKRLIQTGTMHIPFFADINMTVQERTDYLNSYTEFLHDINAGHLKLYRDKLSYSLIVCSGDKAIFFFLRNKRNEDKFVVFDIGRENIANKLKYDCEESKYIAVPLSEDDWTNFTGTLNIVLND